MGTTLPPAVRAISISLSRLDVLSFTVSVSLTRMIDSMHFLKSSASADASASASTTADTVTVSLVAEATVVTAVVALAVTTAEGIFFLLWQGKTKPLRLVLTFCHHSR